MEVNALRRLAEPLLQLLVGRGLVVRFRGTSVDTQFDAEGRPAEITLPLLPDSVDEAVLEVFQGHIDRAAARALFTRRTEATSLLTRNPLAARIFRALEDARTERLMQKRFPGSAYNLERYYERLFAGAVGPEREEADFACAVRAAVGDALFETFAEAQFDERRSTVVDADDDVRPEEEGFDPAALRTHLCRAYAQSFEGETLTEAFDGLNSTEDAARLAAVLAGFLTENDAESDSETECESDGESGASGDSEAESQTEEEEGTGSGDGSTEEAGEGTEDSQAQAEENSDEEDSDEDADEASDGASGIGPRATTKTSERIPRRPTTRKTVRTMAPATSLPGAENPKQAKKTKRAKQRAKEAPPRPSRTPPAHCTGAGARRPCSTSAPTSTPIRGSMPTMRTSGTIRAIRTTGTNRTIRTRLLFPGRRKF